MASGNDMKAHASTYGSFIGLLKGGAIACVLITALVIWLIA